MNYSKPSVSRAIGILKDAGYLDVAKNGYLTLTPSGKKIASGIYERHLVISDLLEYIGVDSKTAEEDACRIEHVISEETFSFLKQYSSKLPK